MKLFDKNLKSLLFTFLAILAISACTDDDNEEQAIEVRDRTEQQIVDNDSMLTYFATHYYNSDFLNSQQNINIIDIEIIEAELDESGNPIVPAGYTMLIDEMDGGRLITIEDPILYEDTEYTYYFLNLNQGGSDFSPGAGDSVQMVYEGLTMDGEIFDSEYNITGGLFLGGFIEGYTRITY